MADFGSPALAGIVQDACLVGFGGSLRVDIDRPQVGLPADGRNLVSYRAVQHISQVRGGVGGQEQGFMPLPRQPDGRDARGDRLAYAAFAGKEQRPAMTVGLQARPHIFQEDSKRYSLILGTSRFGNVDRAAEVPSKKILPTWRSLCTPLISPASRNMRCFE